VVLAVTTQDEDRFAASPSAAKNISVLVADKPRFLHCDLMIALGFLEHPDARFPTSGCAFRVVRTKVNCIHPAAELSEKLRIDRFIFLDGVKSTCDAALIGDHDIEPAVAAEVGETFAGAGYRVHLGEIRGEVHFLHERAISIEEDGSIFLEMFAFHQRLEEVVFLEAGQELIRREGGRSEFANNDGGAMVGNLGCFLQGASRAESQGEKGNGRVAGA
jgi:hypothetical protein